VTLSPIRLGHQLPFPDNRGVTPILDVASGSLVAGAGSVTLLEGSSFAVSDRLGDMVGHRQQGMFYRDTRILSTWRLTADDEPLEPLAVLPEGTYAASFVTRAAPRAGASEATLLVQRRRLVADGLREDVTVANHGLEPAAVRLMLQVDADFADLFDVKDARYGTTHEVRRTVSGREIHLSITHAEMERGVRVRAQDGVTVPTGFVFSVVVPPQGEWGTTVEVLPTVQGESVEAAFPLDIPLHETAPARRVASWRSATPVVESGSADLTEALLQSGADLNALHITDPFRGRSVVAAGAPWFMTLFGRDSLLSAWMALPFDPNLALGTLEALAAAQGREVDPRSEEEPGKILHEVRRGIDPGRALGGRSVYYGSVDATPLFVLVLAEAARWGCDPERVRALLPAADAALEWVEHFGDADGDGFVEYRRKTDRGLLNQGWKDSGDSIASALGRLAEPPIALVEVQAYVYGAYRARADLAAFHGDEEGRRRWDKRAEALRTAVDEAFWLPDRGHYALALDADKRQVDALTSNMGHTLWTGVALPHRAHEVADHLLSSDLFSGWGVRTLAASMTRYNPVSYHNGSVWPHDNALIVAGLVRYGRLEAAQRIATALVEAAAAFGGRLPELFCGFDRAAVPVPVPYPASCSPQAWAAATPISLVRSLLRLNPCVPRGAVALAPAIPPAWLPLRLRNVRLGAAVLDVDTSAERAVSRPPVGLAVTSAAAAPAAGSESGDRHPSLD
jgi:glycogen debranching enzyme